MNSHISELQHLKTVINPTDLLDGFTDAPTRIMTL
jgi:hypothetical protein